MRMNLVKDDKLRPEPKTSYMSIPSNKTRNVEIKSFEGLADATIDNLENQIQTFEDKNQL